MKNWIKIGFVISVILNVLLITGIVLGRSYITRTNFKLAEMTTKSEVNLMKYILSTLDSGEPNDVEQLKGKLRMFIDQGEKASEIWNSAAQK